MTRVFVFEYTSSIALTSTNAAVALNAEGSAMLAAALADFRCVPGVEAFTIDRAPDEEAAFRAAAKSADWSLVVAPEFNDILFNRCRWVSEENGRLLGSTPDIVRLCSDKLALADHWIAHRVPTPATFEINKSATPPTEKWIVKPRFGAGSQGTSLKGPLRNDSEFGPMIWQPYIEGQAASVAFLCGPRHRLALPATEQILSSDGQFHYLGGRLPLSKEQGNRAESIARKAIDAIPELLGYIGVDVALGNDGHDWAIEINPRLTTSYIGLRALAETNLAEAILRIAEGKDPPRLRWRSDGVEFTAAGQITIRASGP